MGPPRSGFAQGAGVAAVATVGAAYSPRGKFSRKSMDCATEAVVARRTSPDPSHRVRATNEASFSVGVSIRFSLYVLAGRFEFIHGVWSTRRDLTRIVHQCGRDRGGLRGV